MITFISSAKNYEGFPYTKCEILFVGRSNVGKSSLINSLYGKIAYVGKTPGKTRLLNFFNVDNKYTVCDAPGYGYAKVSDNEKVDFGEIMEGYFNNRNELKCCILVLDIRRIPNNDDLDMLKYLRYNRIPYFIVLNKSDKLSNNERIKQEKIIIEKLKISNENYISVSTTKSTNINELKFYIEKIVDEYKEV